MDETFQNRACGAQNYDLGVSPAPLGATPHHLTPGCVGSNWREMSLFLARREVKCVLLYIFERAYSCMGVFPEGLHPYACDFRGLTPI